MGEQLALAELRTCYPKARKRACSHGYSWAAVEGLGLPDLKRSWTGGFAACIGWMNTI